MHKEVFAPMNEDLLFRWVTTSASGNIAYTWWFFGALVALALLTVNAIVCSIQAIKGKWTRDDFLLRISPQIVHLGFLFILLAHLLGAGWGYKLSGMMPEGAFAPLPEDMALKLEAINVKTDNRGFTTDWAADALLYENDKIVAHGTLGPNAPLFYKGVGVYLKSLNFDRRPAALLVIAKDPGAVWALVGGLLFMIGAVTLLVLKWKKA
jgi:cytochrome c biogenesis protein ResB